MHWPARLLRGVELVWERVRSVPTLTALRQRLPVAAAAAACLIPVAAIIGYSRTRLNSGLPTDYLIFGPPGADLLRGQWNLVFDHPANTGGPFELIFYGVAYLLRLSGPVEWTIFYTCGITLLVFLFGLASLAALGPTSGRKSFYITLGVAAVGIFAGFFPMAAYSGHPAELMIPLFWLMGAAMARDGRFVACGITIGLSAGFESWGILGFAVIFVASRPLLIRYAVAGAATLVVLYGPFIATGVFRVVGFHWPIFPDSIYGVLFPQLHQFPWSLRILQSVFALAAGWVVALLAKPSRYAVWLVPLAVIAARLAADPLLLFYYWVAPAALALSALGAFFYLRDWIPVAVAAALIICFWLPHASPFLWALGLLVVVLVCAIIVRLRRKSLSLDAEPAG